MRFFLTLAAGTLLMINGATGAPPTGTVYRLVQVDTNGVFVNLSTNIIAANGIARTGTVADAMAAHLLVTNPHAITPAMISAATAAQGAKADTAVQPTDIVPGMVMLISTNVDTNTLVVTGCGFEAAQGSYTWSGSTWGKGDFGILNVGDRFMIQDSGGEIYRQTSLSLPTPEGTWEAATVRGTNPPPSVLYSRTFFTNTATTVATAAMKITDAIWKTNQVLALDGSTNTIVFLGLP